MGEEKVDLEGIRKLIASDKNFAFVLDYALFASSYASRDGSFDAQARIIPDFNKCLEELVKQKVVVMKSGNRYTGPTKYFELTIDRNTSIELLESFYDEVENNVKSLETEIPRHLKDFFYIYDQNGRVDFSVDNYLGEMEHPEVESTCIELVKKGLMFSWTWIAKKHQYRRYRFREQPHNCLQDFNELMKGQLSEFVKAKIKDYLRHEKAARLDFLLGLVRTKNLREVEKYMKERGWSDKLVWETRNCLEKEKMLVSDTSSQIFKTIEKYLSEQMDEIDELSQVKKPQELNKLKIILRKQKFLGKPEAEFRDIVETLERILPGLQEKDIEILRIEKDENKLEVSLSCNRNLYLIRCEDTEFYSLPNFYADKAVIIGRKILDYAFNQFLEQKPWVSLLMIGYQDRYVLGDIEKDALFRYVLETLRRNDIILIEPMESISEYYEKTLEAFKKSALLDEGFVYTEPLIHWQLQQEFLTLLKSSESSIKLCVPYPDQSTFSFLATVSHNVRIKMIITSDRSELKDKKKLSTQVLEKTISGKRIEIKRNPEIHMRFIISDDKKVMFSSADLRDDQLKSKYQYGFWTNNEEIVKKAVEYFENLWKDSTSVDLFEELK